MNAATFHSSMRRLLLLKQKQLLAMSMSTNVTRLPWSAVVRSIYPMRYNSSASSSSSSSSSTPATSSSSSTQLTFGTGEFGRPAPSPKDVVIPPLKPEDEPPPGSDPFSYSPVYRKGRFDFLFGEGWRRPPAKDQGQRMRRDWFCFGYHPTDEYADWKWSHYFMFWVMTVFCAGTVFMLWNRPDWPQLRDWATREAFIEMARREKYGLPYISKDYIDPAKVAATLPSEEELGEFEIII